MLVTPLYSLQVFDRVLTSRSEETLVMLTLITVGTLVILSILETVRSRVLVRLSTWVERALGPALLSYSVQRACLSNNAASTQGLRDLASLRGFIGGAGVFHLFDAPWAPVYIAVTYMLHPWLGHLAVAGAVALFGMALVSEFATRKPLRNASAVSMKLMSQVEANNRNAEAIEAMGMLPALVRSWNEENEKVLSLQGVASDRAGVISAVTKFLRMLIQVAVLALGVYLAIHREIGPGAMIAASIILSRALAPVEQLIATWKSLISARSAYRRINQTLAEPVANRNTTRLPKPRGVLDVEQITVIPPGSKKPSLQSVSFNLAAGESLGIVGPSAAGKSSLARLLVGVWPPYQGAVRLDSADVFQWDREQFGQHVGYLPQDVELFDGTVKQNIARMAEPNDESAIEAARIAGVHEMILRLPQGYETVIGDGGAKLSGGQRQRIALARAFYGDPKFVVLDEPNANLDSEGEQALSEALRKAKERQITVVIIAHRPSILAFVDKLLVLRDGRVDKFGPRDEVMAQLTRVAPLRAVPAAAQQAPSASNAVSA
jgi:PrtD family type I secretion system ABC transporter